MGMTQAELDAMPVLMTEAEVARFLGKSTETVKRLRVSGELPYLPGRPPMSRKSDVLAYVERNLKRAKPATPEAPRQKTQAEVEADARAWALKQRLKFPRAKRSKPSPA